MTAAMSAMDDQATVLADIELGEPRPPAQKVCIIGSSYIGAPLRAHREFQHEEWHHEFSFLGAANKDFPQVAIRDGKITGHTHKEHETPEQIAHYDYFVIYGDMVIPHEIAKFEARLSSSPHSRALRTAMLNDWTRLRHSRRVAEQLVAATSAPVFLLPRNVTAKDMPQDPERYMLGVRLLSRFFAPVIFMEMPYEIMGEGFITHPAYHKGSLELGGNASDRNGHDLDHMNIAGGRMVLKHIARTITQHYFSRNPP